MQPPAKPQPAAQQRPSSVRWIVLTLACFSSGFLYLHRYTWNVIRPELASEYGFNNTQLEAIFTVFYTGYTVGQIPSGIICDFFGAHLFLVVIIAAWSVSLACLGFGGSLYGLGAVRVVFGTAQAGCYPALGQVTQKWFPRSSRTFVQGLVASFFGRGGGAMSSIIMATVLMGYCGLSWRVALVVMSAAGLFFAGAFLYFYRNSPDEDPRVNEAERRLISKDQPPADPGAPKVLPMRRVVRNSSMLVMIFQQVLNAGADIVYTSVMGSYFLSKGISTAEMGFLVSMPLWGGAVGGVVGGLLNDWLIRATGSRRWGRTLVGFSGKLTATLMLFVAISQRDAWAAGIGLFIVKFFTDWSQPTIWGTCTDLGGRYSATVFSIINTAGNVGALVTPLVVGPLLDFYTTKTQIGGETVSVTDYTPMFVMVGVMYAICACCWFGVDCTKSLEVEQ